MTILGRAIEKVTEEHKQLFELQYALVKQHSEMLKQTFLVTKPIETENLENVLKNNPNIFKEKKYNQIFNTSGIAQNRQSEDNKKLRDKNYLLTEEEVDNYLLKTVFHVDFLKVIT